MTLIKKGVTLRMVKPFLVIPTWIAFGVLVQQPGFAGNWGLSVAHNNPAGASVGGNLTYFGQAWAFEIGVGSIGGNLSGNRSQQKQANGSLGGDIDLKYRFLTQFFQPYIEAGFGLGIGGNSKTGASANTGSAFAGAGFFLMGSKVYGMIGGDLQFTTESLYGVAGLGVKF